VFSNRFNYKAFTINSVIMKGVKMFICHIAMYTKDLERLKDFYTKYFSGKCNNKYHNSKTGLETYFITFEGGTKLELMQKPDLTSSSVHTNAEGLTHLAFSVGSKEEVDCLTKLLVSDGYTLHSAPRTTGDGFYESSILDPDNNIIEITQ